MSINPNDPFDSGQSGQGSGQSPPPGKSGKKLGVGLVVLGALGGAGMLVIGGFYFALSSLADEYQRQLAGEPVIEQHIGEIESLSFSWAAMVAEAQSADQHEDETGIAFEITGSKGSGYVMIEQNEADQHMIRSATLVLPGGERVPIDVLAGDGVFEAPLLADPSPN